MPGDEDDMRMTALQQLGPQIQAVDIRHIQHQAGRDVRLGILQVFGSRRERHHSHVDALVATVASGYIQLRALDRQLEIARFTSRSLGEAARLQKVRFEEGAVPESDYQQAESQYRETLSREAARGRDG